MPARMPSFGIQNIPVEFKPGDVMPYLRRGLWDEANLQKRLFRKASRGWKNTKPDITSTDIKETIATLSLTSGALKSGAGNNVYSWINWGTKKRIIRPNTKKYLRFQRGYYPSTTPGTLSSHTKRRFGPWTAKKSVRHQIAARGFDEVVARQREDKFVDAMQEQMDKFADNFWL